MYYAHIDNLGFPYERRQLLKDHSKQAQLIAEKAGAKLGISHITGLAALFHDVGKYTVAFQEYLLNISTATRGSIDHSSAGGQLLEKWLGKKLDSVQKMTLEMIQNAIFSHHSQLKDTYTTTGEMPMLNRLTKELDSFDEIEKNVEKEIMTKAELAVYFEKAVAELKVLLVKGLKNELPHIPTLTNQSKGQRMRVYTTFITKAVMSILLDADRTDARLFSENKGFKESSNQQIFKKYQEILEAHVLELNENAKKSVNTDKAKAINELRKKMSDTCYEAGKLKSNGIYQLSMPTGGGKTLASLRFALAHALEQKKEHIIYVIPYTSIIEQNANDVKTLLKDKDNILEHHSNFIDTSKAKRSWYLRQLQMDNWDAPIIFTTMVQYLNIFFENGARSTRRLHRLLNSVVIFDEIQAIPPKTLHMFNESLNFMKSVADNTAVLCTATQPALSHVKKGIIHGDGEIITLSPAEQAVFERVKPEIHLERRWSNKKLVAEILQSTNDGSVLCIFNTKKTADLAYESLLSNNQNIAVYFLTTGMCAAHRLNVLKEMKEKLEKKVKVICLSTSLIEAGVNVSFHTVFRTVAGLDSLAQAAGRCNRHGELGIGRFVVFSHESDYLSFSFELETAHHQSYVLCKQLSKTPQRMFEQTMITHYFKSYYNALSESFLNYPVDKGTNLYDLLFSSNQKYFTGISDFQLRAAHDTVGQAFKPIDQETISVIVPYEEGITLIDELLVGKVDGNIYKKAQRYLINLFDNQFEQLMGAGMLTKVVIDEAVFYVLGKAAYDDIKGLDYPANLV